MKKNNHQVNNNNIYAYIYMQTDLVNEFHRFCGKDEVLEWDEFWRFMKDLNLGITDLEIGQMRQKADINRDGVRNFHNY
jgi:hypothetical protein